MRVFTCLVATLAVLASLAFSTPADAAPPVQTDGPIGFIYWSDGYLAMVGDALDFCVNPEPPTAPGAGTVVTPGNGSTIEFSRADVPVSVYEFPGPEFDVDPEGGFVFLGANCGAIFDGDPTTVPIEAVAAGEVRLRAKFRTDADGVTNSHNSLVGRVTTTNGDRVHLSTSAKVIFTDGGATLIDLSQLAVRYGGA